MADLSLVILAAVFAAWWIVSACNQVRSGALTAQLRRYIPFSLIPLWTFFAPNPARADVRLVWREEYGSVWGDWQELHFGYAPARSRWLVNPELILNKAVTDLAYSLLRVRPNLDDRSILLTSAYVTLLSIVVSHRQGVMCSSLQFAIVRSFATSHTRQVDVAFVSEVHGLVDMPAHVHAS